MEKGRACGAATSYYARALMVRHKFKNTSHTVLKDIIGKKYGTYELMDNYGDNFREGLPMRTTRKAFSVQFLDLESQGTDDGGLR